MNSFILLSFKTVDARINCLHHSIYYFHNFISCILYNSVSARHIFRHVNMLADSEVVNETTSPISDQLGCRRLFTVMTSQIGK